MRKSVAFGLGALTSLAAVALVLAAVWLERGEPSAARREPAPIAEARTGAAPPEERPSLGLDVPRITSTRDFEAMATEGPSGVVLGRSVKFLIDARDPEARTVHFINGRFEGAVLNRRAPTLHYFFAVEVLGISMPRLDFDDVTYRAEEKTFVAGTVQEYRLVGEDTPTYAIQFTPQDPISEAELGRAVLQTAEHLSLPDARVVFVSTGLHQTTETVGAQLEAKGVKVLALDQVLGAVEYLPMNPGEAWGILRVFPEDLEDLTAEDIPVFDELPLDLSVVAATITRAVQDNGSHINLKAKERGTPNMVLRSAGPRHPRLASLADRPVHLRVEAGGYTLEPSTLAEVRARRAERSSLPWQPLQLDREAGLASFDSMCGEEASACLKATGKWGGKAAKLGFLRHGSVVGEIGLFGLAEMLGYEPTPRGVGVPVVTYHDFVAANPDLASALATFIAREKAGTSSPRERREAIAKLQALFMGGRFPPGVVQEIRDMAISVFPEGTRDLKVRSSANAEDLPGFDGAGLYDSFRASLSATPGPCRRVVDPRTREVSIRPRTLECVIKGVYASLWNRRAVEERSYARVDHATAGMGLAIVPRYRQLGDIVANVVVITRPINASGVFGYTLSSQRGNSLVTNPEPGTHAESIAVGLLPYEEATFSVVRFARPDPGGPELRRTVMSKNEMLVLLEIVKRVEVAYCLADPAYYPASEGCPNVIYDDEKPTALDLELKLYADGRFLLKQVREFGGR
ncbi:MAG: PEP/pyruvate-binding domain-containing protein [Deltaproteobacteria bacterium]|nr:PEP/pyruvate-binding domain-containing protein [Deltaproteobacteria bacterium]